MKKTKTRILKTFLAVMIALVIIPSFLIQAYAEGEETPVPTAEVVDSDSPSAGMDIPANLPNNPDRPITPFVNDEPLVEDQSVTTTSNKSIIWIAGGICIVVAAVVGVVILKSKKTIQ